MSTAIQKWGNSQGIRIPKHILDLLHWDLNEKVNIIPDGDKIVIEKEQAGRKNIRELFADFHDDYQPTKIDWGETEGKEIW